ncbi:MAG TPA: Hsp20/alpha crystallin family protein [Usitatibacter sp.]|jgi:HSP20 family molecular chaperone IbpA|nr:Hsp20/alpha crystallin family protein [Usitatibacter sp.]
MDMKQKNLERPANAEATPLVPPVDIVEDAEGILVTADLPGVAKEDVAVGVEGDTLTIEGVVSLGETASMQPVYAEIGVAQFRRSFVLSRDLDTARIQAQMKDGVLRLRVPKHEQAKPRRIEVRAE